MTAILHIDQQGLSLWRDGEPVVVSPACITVDGKQAVIGEAALRQLKLKPTASEDEFWDRFGTDPLIRRSAMATTQADLAYLHLQDFCQHLAADEAVAVVVPDDFAAEQSALLLGMLNRLKVPVRAFVASSIACLVGTQPGRQLHVIQLLKQRLTLSTLSQGDWLSIDRIEVERGLGLARWREAASLAIADTFINATRLDPLHNAAVEQQMHDRLLGWLAELSTTSEITVQLGEETQNYRATISRQQIERATARLRQTLLAMLSEQVKPPATLLLPTVLLSMPGLGPALMQLPGIDIKPLAAPSFADDWLDGAAADQVVLVASKPWFDSAQSQRHESELADFSRQAPTHLLHDGVTHPIGAELLVGSSEQAELCLRGAGVNAQHLRLVSAGDGVVVQLGEACQALLNGRPVETKQRLAAGDRIQIGDPAIELQLIAVG